MQRHPRRQHAIYLIVVTLSLIFSMILTAVVEASQRSAPFRPGEKLTYRVRWGFIPAGEATLEVLPTTSINGIVLHHFAMTTKTNAYVDLIYKVRERQDSYTDIAMTHTVLYKKRSEGKHPRDVIVSLDWKKCEATYTNFGEKMNPIALVPGSFDPLALFFAIRVHDLREHATIELPITDGKKLIVAKGTILRETRCKVAGRTYDTYVIEPDMQRLDGVFDKGGNAHLAIWFTADEDKIPVKIRSNVGVGSFIFELVSVEE